MTSQEPSKLDMIGMKAEVYSIIQPNPTAADAASFADLFNGRDPAVPVTLSASEWAFLSTCLDRVDPLIQETWRPELKRLTYLIEARIVDFLEGRD